MKIYVGQDRLYLHDFARSTAVNFWVQNAGETSLSELATLLVRPRQTDLEADNFCTLTP
jgi:thiaminase